VKTTTVTVGKTVSFRNEYGNMKMELTAEVRDGESSIEVFQSLANEIDGTLQKRIAEHYKFFWDAVRANEAIIEDARAKAYKACDLLADAAKAVSGVQQQMNDGEDNETGEPF
jgi:hypothetical protein